MSNKLLIFLSALILLFAGLACEESGSKAKPDSSGGQTRDEIPDSVLEQGDRILELDVNPAQNQDYDAAVEQAHQLGAESIRLSIFWDDIETAPGEFKPDPNWLAVANSYYPAQDLQLSLVISVLDTTEIRLPEDLEDKELDDPLVIERFAAFLDYIASQTPDLKLTSLAIGNEIDGVLGSDPAAWQAYENFLKPAVEKAHQVFPGVPVGTKVMYEGLTGSTAELAQSLNTTTDVVMATYYPLAGDFSVRNPQVVAEDFQTLVNQYPDREIHITEIGYPTGKANQSSQEKQADFIQEMFSAWDAHAEQITLLSYSWLHDLPEESVSELTRYYGLSNRAFGEFLRTLGLRTYSGSGQDKSGFEVFQQEASARGWK